MNNGFFSPPPTTVQCNFLDKVVASNIIQSQKNINRWLISILTLSILYRYGMKLSFQQSFSQAKKILIESKQIKDGKHLICV